MLQGVPGRASGRYPMCGSYSGAARTYFLVTAIRSRRFPGSIRPTLTSLAAAHHRHTQLQPRLLRFAADLLQRIARLHPRGRVGPYPRVQVVLLVGLEMRCRPILDHAGRCQRPRTKLHHRATRCRNRYRINVDCAGHPPDRHLDPLIFEVPRITPEEELPDGTYSAPRVPTGILRHTTWR